MRSGLRLGWSPLFGPLKNSGSESVGEEILVYVSKGEIYRDEPWNSPGVATNLWNVGSIPGRFPGYQGLIDAGLATIGAECGKAEDPNESEGILPICGHPGGSVDGVTKFFTTTLGDDKLSAENAYF